MRGVMILSELAKRWFGILAPFMPKIIVITYVLYKVFKPFFLGLSVADAFLTVAKNLLGAELVLQRVVNEAMVGAFSYLSLFDLVGTIFFIYYFAKIVGDIVIGVTGSQARWMAYVFAFFVYAVIELGAITVIDGGVSFIPIKDGVFYFITNLDVVISGFDAWPW